MQQAVAAEEAALIAALKSATYAPRVRRARGNPVASKDRRVILGDDLKERFAAIDNGPEHAMRHTIRGIINFVESEEFVVVARAHGRFP